MRYLLRVSRGKVSADSLMIPGREKGRAYKNVTTS